MRPSQASGPWAIISDEGRTVPVRAEPATGATPVTHLAVGTLVRLECASTQGPVVPAPKALGPAHSNNVWDRIVSPAGWIPDSFVATYSVRPVVPACA